MDNYKNIVCATDFSAHSRAAAERAAQLARLHGAGLILLHVVEYFPEDSSNEFIAPEDVDPATYREQRARDALAELAAALGDISPTLEVRFSTHSAKHVIVDFAEERHVDLIVLASHGHHGLVSLLGSTACGVAHKVPCDVYIVRAEE